MKPLGTRFLEPKAAALLALLSLSLALLTGKLEIPWYDAASFGIASALLAIIALASGILVALASPSIFASARKRYLFRQPLLLLNLTLLTASIAIWPLSVYSPKSLHLNRGPNLSQTLFLIPHRVVFASLEFPPNPDAQAASRLRPPGFLFDDVNPRDYDGTFAWRSLGFHSSTGPYPQLILVPATGQTLSFTLNQSSWIVPLWIFPPLCSFIPNLYLLQFLRRHSRNRQGLCPVCRYDLRAHLPGHHCPECGTTIIATPRPLTPETPPPASSPSNSPPPQSSPS